MLNHEQLITICEAAENYNKHGADPTQILHILGNLAPEEFAYLCRCLCNSGGGYYLNTTEHLLEVFPKHITTMGEEYLAELLHFPWNGQWFHHISPIRVTFGVAKKQGFLLSTKSNLLVAATRDYLEQYPESAPNEFLYLQRWKPSLAEDLWGDLSQSLRDEVTQRFWQQASWDLKRFERAHIKRKSGDVEATIFEGMAKTFQMLARSSIPRTKSHDAVYKPLLALSTHPEIKSALPFLRRWIDAHSALFAERVWRSGIDLIVESTSAEGEIQKPREQIRSSGEKNTESETQRDRLISQLSAQLWHDGLVVAQHAPVLSDLTPSEFCYLWAGQDIGGWHRGNFKTIIQCIVPQFVDSFGHDFLFDVLNCPLVRRERPEERLNLVYWAAQANGLLSVRHRARFADAFSKFLISHPDTCTQEFLSIYDGWNSCMTESFAASVFASLTPDLQVGIERGFEEIIARQLRWVANDDEKYSHVARWFKTELESKAGIQDDRRTEELSPRTKRALESARFAFQSFIKQAKERGLEGGAVSDLTTIIALFAGAGLKERDQRRGEEEAQANFLLRHKLSAGFAKPRYLNRQVDKTVARFLTSSGTALVDRPVFVGASVPLSIAPGAQFVARLYAYVEEWQTKVEEALKKLNPTNRNVPSLRMCRWRIGETVVVRVHGERFSSTESEARFEWNGAFEIVDFPLTLHNNAPLGSAVLGFDVEVAGVRVASIRIEIGVSKKPEHVTQRIASEAARTGFASYASSDRYEVMGRVSSIELRTGIHVFVDCLDLHPSKRWMPVLHDEICERDIFLLFWSASAGKSKWVTWEWKTALKNKPEESMEIHALQPPHLAPAPKELAHLHFGDRLILARSPFNPYP